MPASSINKIAAPILLSLGFYLPILITIGLAANAISFKGKTFDSDSSSPEEIWVPQLELSRDGKPLWETQNGASKDQRIYTTTHKWQNAQGEPVDFETTLTQRFIDTGNYNSYKHNYITPILPTRYKVPFIPNTYLQNSYLPNDNVSYFTSPFLVDRMAILGEEKEFWYFIIERSPHPTAYLEGFNRITGKRIGYLGHKGLQAEKPVVSERFPLQGYNPGSLTAFWHEVFNHNPGYPVSQVDYKEINGWQVFNKVWIAVADGILELDIGTREVREFAKMEGLSSIKLVPPPITKKHNGSTDVDATAYMILASTKEQILLLSKSGKIIGKVNIPKEGWQTLITFYCDPIRGLTLSYPLNSIFLARPEARIEIQSNQLPESGKFNQKLETYGPEGQILNEETVSMQPLVGKNPYANNSNPVGYYLCLVNPVSDFTFQFIPGSSRIPKPDLFPWILAGTLFNLFLIVLIAMRQRQFGESLWTIPLWSLLIIVFGLAGWLGYRFHRAWPPLVGCPNCKTKRPCNLAQCPKCHATFAKPQLTGKEIFSDAPTLQALGGI